MSSAVRGEDTPPPPTSLIWEAPCRSCSRTRRRTSSALSAIIAPPDSSIGLSGPPGLLGMSCSGRKAAVAAGGGDHRAARINAGPGHDAFVDRLFERERATAEIANGGEAAHQRAL